MMGKKFVWSCGSAVRALKVMAAIPKAVNSFMLRCKSFSNQETIGDNGSQFDFVSVRTFNTAIALQVAAW